MVAEDFILAKQQAWDRLDQLVSRAQSNIVVMQPHELQELGRLYRQATSDLARARRDYPGHPMTVYLNDLIAQSHNAIYREQGNPVTGIRYYFAVQLPRAFRQTLPFTLAALLIFMIPMVVGWVIAAQDPNKGLDLMPELKYVVQDMRANERWWENINDDNAGSAALILTNNISVAIRAFVGGLSLGLFSVYVLYFNGLMLGVVGGAAQNIGFSDTLWNFVIAHAVVELSIIIIAGGAGLSLAWSILRPGLLSRRQSLRQAAQRAFHLSGAIVLFLIVAGLIEGFISPSALPFWFKATVAVVSGALMYAYLFLAGRATPVVPQQDQLS